MAYYCYAIDRYPTGADILSVPLNQSKPNERVYGIFKK